MQLNLYDCNHILLLEFEKSLKLLSLKKMIKFESDIKAPKIAI